MRALEASLGDTHTDVGDACQRMSIFLDALGQRAESNALLERAVAIYEASGNVRRAMWWLVRHGEADDADAALALHTRVLAKREAMLDATDLHVADSLTHVALALKRLKRSTEALALLQRALAIREAALQRDPLNAWQDVAEAHNNFGSALHDQGRHDEARRHYETALQMREAALGPRHSEVATVISNLADLMRDEGDLVAARAFDERALTIDIAVHGTLHPACAVSSHNLAATLHALDDTDGARSLFHQALEIDERVYGRDSVHVAAHLVALARVLKDCGEYNDSSTAFERALDIYKRTGAHAFEVRECLVDMCALAKRRGDLGAARAVLREALAIDEAAVDTAPENVLQTCAEIGRLAKRQGDSEEARRVFERALSVSEVHVGAGHANLLEALNNLATLCLDTLKEYARARLLFERALALRADERSCAAAEMRSNLAVTMREQGDLPRARSMFMRALSIRIEKRGDAHVDVGKTHVGLGKLARLHGDYGVARMHLERARVIFEAAGAEKLVAVVDSELGAINGEAESDE